MTSASEGEFIVLSFPIARVSSRAARQSLPRGIYAVKLADRRVLSGLLLTLGTWMAREARWASAGGRKLIIDLSGP